MKDEEDTQEYDEEYEEEMSTPLYLVSSIFFLIGCLFYTMSAILWCVRDALLYGTNTVNRSFLSYPFYLFCSYLCYLHIFRLCCFFIFASFSFFFVPPFFLRRLPGIFVRSLETILGYFWQVIIFFLEQVQISEANSRAKFYYHLCRGKLDISYVYGVVLKLTIEIFYLRCVNTNIRCH